jgi:hypothetical protein
MNALGVVAIGTAIILAIAAAVFADRVLDAAVGGSYALVRRAQARRGRAGFRLAVLGAAMLAIGLTIVGILANAR